LDLLEESIIIRKQEDQAEETIANIQNNNNLENFKKKRLRIRLIKKTNQLENEEENQEVQIEEEFDPNFNHKELPNNEFNESQKPIINLPTNDTTYNNILNDNFYNNYDFQSPKTVIPAINLKNTEEEKKEASVATVSTTTESEAKKIYNDPLFLNNIYEQQQSIRILTLFRQANKYK
jgi:hypothetical protein